MGKVTALAAITSLSTDDILYAVDDPGGTPVSKKITWDNTMLSITKLGTVATGVWNGTVVGLAYGGTGANLSDPNADRIAFWDDSAGAVTWLVPNTNLEISTTNLNVKPNLTIAPVTLTDQATIATDASLSNRFRVTLADNRTLGNPTNATNGQQVVWEIIQDATGNRTLAYDTQFAFGTDITGATLSTAANKRDFLTAIYNSTTTKWYVVGFVKGY